MTSKPVDALHAELRAASPDLVDNADLLRSVLSGCGDCIKVLDLDGRLQFMSEGGKRVMEVDDFSLLKGCPWPGFWPGEGQEQAAQAVTEAKAGRSARFRGPANTAKGTPRYWDVQVSPIFGPDKKPAHLLSISRDITEEWKASQLQEEAAKRERFLTEELEHRLKNAFSLMLAIANQTFRGEEYAVRLKAFSSRILALSRAHDAVRTASWTDVPIREVIEQAIASHRTGQGRFKVSGTPLNVYPNQAVSLMLAVNELATNAAKYGALSSNTGEVEILWSTSTNGSGSTFDFSWRERGGPRVIEPTRQGFGSRVIKDFMANDFGGAVDLSYDPNGVVCELKSPLERLPA